MIELNAKYEIGEEVYTIAQKKFTMPCPMCNASKIITYNGVTVKCPNCNGTGEFEVNKMVWSVVDDLKVVSAIKATIHQDNNVVKYKLSAKIGYSTVLNRCEDAVFKTKEDAEKECNKRNEVHMDVKVADIKITTAFNDTIPAPSKIAKRVEEYKKQGKFDTAIIVNKDGYLLDGYSAYLVCKMLGIEILRAVIR